MRSLLIITLLIIMSSCAATRVVQEIPPKREFRGVWIATVVNIDWPYRQSLDWDKQQLEYLELLDHYQALNFNAVIVQIRTAGDAFYPTDLAPWSRYITGTEGLSPVYIIDPLEWMISEAHKRGMEFHAWLNPYRATFDDKIETVSLDHDFYRHPEWMIKYGPKYYYDPGNPEVKAHLVAVIKDIVDRYPVDAIHFDDYFYPYKIAGEIFDDQTSFELYADEGETLDDWRRGNVNHLVRDIHEMIQRAKPWVQFGISPFGVWRNSHVDPRGSDTRAGQTNYDDLYADALTWMERGWIDYLIPQLYWSMDFELASHKKLADWWAENNYGVNIYIGNGPYKIRNNDDKAWDDIEEIPRQVAYARELQAVQGNAFFSAKSLKAPNLDVANLLRARLYDYTALTPTSPFAVDTNPSAVSIVSSKYPGDSAVFALAEPLSDDVTYAVVYGHSRKSRLNTDDPLQIIAKVRVQSGDRIITLPMRKRSLPRHLAFTVLNRYGRESTPTQTKR